MGARPITTEEVARRAGLHDIYVVAYDVLSREVHVSVSALDSHVRLNKDTERIEGFNYGPSQKETTRAICLSGMWLAEELGELSNLFGEDLKDLCGSHIENFKILLPNIEEPPENPE